MLELPLKWKTPKRIFVQFDALKIPPGPFANSLLVVFAVEAGNGRMAIVEVSWAY